MSYISNHKKAWAKHKGEQTIAKTAIASTYTVWLAQSKIDWKRLKQIADLDERNTHKPAVIAQYKTYLQQWMDNGETHQNDPLVINIILSLDCGHYKWMLTLADYAIKTNQKNNQFERDIATLIYDTLLKGAEDRFNSDDRTQEVAFLAVLSRIDNKQWQPAPHFIPASRYYRIGGLISQRDGQWQTALDYYTKATQLKADIGVKGRIQDMEKKLQAPPTPPTSLSSTDAKGSNTNHDDDQDD